jgi:hypothetical protein
LNLYGDFLLILTKPDADSRSSSHASINLAKRVNQCLQVGRRTPKLHEPGLLEIGQLMRDLEDHFELVDAEDDDGSWRPAVSIALFIGEHCQTNPSHPWE